MEKEMEMQLAITSATGLPRRSRGAYYAVLESGGQRMCTEADPEACWGARFTLELPCAGADESWSVALRVMRKGVRILGGQAHTELGSVVVRGRNLVDCFRYTPPHVRGLRFVSFRLSGPAGRPSPVIVNLSLSMYGLGWRRAAPAPGSGAVSCAASGSLFVGHSCVVGIPVSKAVTAHSVNVVSW